PPSAPSPDLIDNLAAMLRQNRSMTLDELRQKLNVDGAAIWQGLRQLANAGQVIYDVVAQKFRWRQIMPKALGEAEIGPEHPELIGARQIMARDKAELTSRDYAANNMMVLGGKVESTPVESMVDQDPLIRRRKWLCGYYQHFR